MPPATDAPLAHIQELAHEEHRLLDLSSRDAAQDQRLKEIQVQLDQCWDLLRQRRALRETGGDPADAHLRPPGVVEKYVG
jgi:hypothetical protein